MKGLIIFACFISCIMAIPFAIVLDFTFMILFFDYPPCITHIEDALRRLDEELNR